ncbi:(deoxy)nucleoside triphosphate pyrophosphohydrolase [Alphaproteobacteria bacterium]|nr:(deoxy)nucleoside triphosphate pyrophosphohydrolase [Alphaproteobacteria bacterium]
MSKVITSVVAGIIVKEDQILIAQRSDKVDHPLKWEFPGGKLLPNESTNQALIREFKEELSIEIKKPYFLMKYIYEYKHLKKVHLSFFKIDDYLGKIANNIHSKVIWTNVTDIKSYDFLDGDIKIIENIVNANILGLKSK